MVLKRDCLIASADCISFQSSSFLIQPTCALNSCFSGIIFELFVANVLEACDLRIGVVQLVASTFRLVNHLGVRTRVHSLQEMRPSTGENR